MHEIAYELRQLRWSKRPKQEFVAATPGPGAKAWGPGPKARALGLGPGFGARDPGLGPGAR